MLEGSGCFAGGVFGGTLALISGEGMIFGIAVTLHVISDGAHRPLSGPERAERTGMALLELHGERANDLIC
jgi:hypothetical protein